MTLTLELGPDCLASPNRIHLAIIEAMMLWPNDQGRRELSVMAALAAENGFPTGVAALSGEAEEAFVKGMQVASVLLDVVGSAAVGSELTIGTAASRVAARLAASQDLRPSVRRQSESTFNNTIWPVYRSVAHLWAASSLMQGVADEWPCRMRDIGVFLAVAEDYRSRGERTKSSPKSPTTVLRPGDAVAVASDLLAVLPRGRMKFSRSIGKRQTPI